MAVETLTEYALVLEECCVCFTPFAMTRFMYQRRKQDGQNFYCPAGHSQSYTGNENSRLKAKVAQLEQQLSAKAQQAATEADARRKAEEKLRRAESGLKKATTNARAGLCPFGCRRHFASLANHIKAKHPEKAGA